MLAISVVVLALIAAAVYVGVDRSRPSGTPSSTMGPVATGTFLGPDGVESRAIIAENALPGSTAWHITKAHAGGFVQGFASTTYAAAGQSVNLYVTTSARHIDYRVEAFRMGYYGGDGARLVWTSGEYRGAVQSTCKLTAGINMVSCDAWHRSLTVHITSIWTQGDYLLKLVGAGGQQSYIPLTIWDPTGTGAYLMVERSLVEEGWNTYGGYDLYVGEGSCAPTYPVCNRARVVSFDRPYAESHGAADFLFAEEPLVYWGEEHGLDFDYVTDVTLTQHPDVMLDHKAILSLSHDEIWTNQERLGALSAMNHGVNIVFFGAASVLRHARLQSSPVGPDREVVDYRDAAEDPLNGVGPSGEVTGNTWDSPPTNYNEDSLTGEGYSGYDVGTERFPFVVFDASNWIFAGTGLKKGDAIPDVIKSDIDHVDLDAGYPSDLEVLGHSPLPIPEIYTNQGDWSGRTYSDLTYWTSPSSRAGVIDTGDVNWIAALTFCPTKSSCPAPFIDKITGNMLRAFGQGPAGATHPSRNNLSSVRPTGS